MNRLLCIAALCAAAPCCFAESAPAKNAEHERVVAAAIKAMAYESGVAASAVARADADKDGVHTTTLSAPYSTWNRLAAKSEVRVRSTAGGKPEIRSKVTTGNLVWTRHKDFDERLDARIERCLSNAPLADTRPTSLPPEPIPAPKATEPPSSKIEKKK